MQEQSRAGKNKIPGLVPNHLLTSSPRYVNMRRGWLKRACPHQGFHHDTGRAQVVEALQQVPASGGGNGSTVARLRQAFYFVLEQALSFCTRHHPCRRDGALAGTQRLRSLSPVPVHVHCIKGMTRSEGQEGATGDGSRVRAKNGGGNGD